MKDALELVYKHNLCTYYLLPLIGLNRFSFGVDSNFKNCYVNREGTELHVEVEFLLQRLENIPQLLRIEINGTNIKYVLELPSCWNYDFTQYSLGRYTMFSQTAKEFIYHRSGLCYKSLNADNRMTTDIRLLAIDSDFSRRNILRQKLIEYYGVYIDEDAELLSPPTDSSYIITNQSLTAN